MKTCSILVVLCVSLASSVWAQDNRNAVVKIFTASNAMDYYRPWQSKGVESSTGSGAVISGKRILTNAHVVADHTFVQVKKNGDPKPYTAKVEVIGYDCDLALLTVLDGEFFNDIKPFEFGELPYLQDTVTVLGYPQGGDKLSLTAGVVSRIEINSYSISMRRLLTVQIDAAINPGNSGGPVLQDGKIVGVAMQVLQAGQNIGYMIPVPIINHFMKDWSDGQYDGFPTIGIEFASTENEALRKFYRLEDIEGGVLINNVVPFSPAEGILFPGDVVLSIKGIPIGTDGAFSFRKDERLILIHLVAESFLGDDLDMEIFRNGEKKKVSVPLKDFPKLVPEPYSKPQPSYFIYGGLVFTTLTQDLLESWGPSWWERAPIDFTVHLFGSKRFNADRKEEIVILMTVLPDDVNVGYQDYGNQIITMVNGREFKSFKEFVGLVRSLKTDAYMIFKTDQNMEIILNNLAVDEADAGILERNHIPQRASDDVEEWLKGHDS